MCVPLFLLSGCLLFGQPVLPPFLSSVWPAEGSVGVPTNTRIAAVPGGAAAGGLTLVLRTAGGALVETSTSAGPWGYFAVPKAELQQNTAYRCRVSASSNPALPAYEVSFTTGTGPDRTAPRVESITPAGGSAGLPLIGAITILFNKPLLSSAMNGAPVVLSPLYGYADTPMGAISADRKSVTVPYGAGGSARASALTITVDAAKLQDMSGNTGAGVSSASYLTVIASPSTPAIRAIYPAPGDEGVVTNVSLRVLYDSVMRPLTAAAFSLTCGGAAIALENAMFGSERGFALKPKLLLPPETVCRWGGSAAVQDATGRRAAPFEVEFRTGPIFAVEDVRVTLSPQLNESGPRAPTNLRAGLRASMPLHPVTCSLPAQFYSREAGVASVAARCEWLDDRMGFVLTPERELIPNTKYEVQLPEAYTLSGAAIRGSNIAFTTGNGPLTAAPVIETVTPGDGASGVTLEPAVLVQLSAPVGLSQTREPLRLWRDGAAVAARTRVDDNSRTISLEPATALAPETEYTVQISGLTDLAGSTAPEQTTRFRTGAGTVNYSRPPLLVATVPAASAVDVDRNAAIEFLFDRNPGTVRAASRIGHGAVTWPFRTEQDGERVRLIPLRPLPPATAIDVTAAIMAQDGRTPYNFGFRFRTALGDNSAPAPEVSSITPPPGAIAGGLQRFTVTFSEPMDPATADAKSVFFLNGNYRANLTLTWSEDWRSVSFSLYLDAQGPYGLTLTPALLGLNGRPLQPYTAQFAAQPSPLVLPWSSPRLETRPLVGARLANAREPITFLLKRPVDPALARASLLPLVNGAPWPGTFVFSHDNQVIVFYSDAAYPVDAQISFFDREKVLGDQNWIEFQGPAKSPAPGMRLVRSSVLRTAWNLVFTPTSIYEFEFTDELPAADSVLTLALSTGYNQWRTVASAISRPRPRVLRVTPQAPLAPGVYSFEFGPRMAALYGSTRSTTFSVSKPLEERAASFLSAPLGGASGVPPNALISLSFDEPANPLTLTDDSVQVYEGTERVYCSAEMAPGEIGLRLTPRALLRPGAAIRVVVKGLEDRLGRPYPDAVWNFTVGVALDFLPPVIEAMNIPRQQRVVVAPGSSIQFRFNEPIDPVGQNWTSAFDPVISSARLSPDLRTLTYKLRERIARGSEQSISLGPVGDLAGNKAGSESASVRIAFAEDTTPPALREVWPADGSSELPQNLRIFLAADELLAGPPVSNIRLFAGDEEIPLKVDPVATSLLVLRPANILAADVEYRLVIADVADLAGNVTADGREIRFRTAAKVATDQLACTANVQSILPRNAALRLRFSKPVVPASLQYGLQLRRFAGVSSEDAAAAGFKAVMAPDRLTAEIVPDSGWADGQRYGIKATGVMDDAGNACDMALGTFETTFRPGEEDHTPPRVVLSPPDGSSNLPSSIALTAVADELVDAGLLAEPALRLTRDGVAVFGKVTQFGSVLRFTPEWPLESGATYRLEALPLPDAAGNFAAPVASTFTLDPKVRSDYGSPRVAATDPPPGAVGVSPDTIIRYTFDELLSALPPDTDCPIARRVGPNNAPIPGKMNVAGREAALTPRLGLPGAAKVDLTLSAPGTAYTGGCQIADLSGNWMRYTHYFSFNTAALPDTEPPRVIDVQPPPGTPLRARPSMITLRMSEPVLMESGAVKTLGGTRPLEAFSAYVDPAADSLILVLIPPPSSVLTLYGGPGIMDLAGNELAPFEWSWPTLEAESRGGPAVVKTAPQSGASNVDPNTSILLEFGRPMHAASVQAAVFVVAGGRVVNGKLEMEQGARVARFTPAAPLPAGGVAVYVERVAMDVDGVPMQSVFTLNFSVANKAAGSIPQAVGKALAASAFAGRPALEVEYNQPLNAATIHADSVWLRSGTRRIAGVAALRGDRVLRFEPDETLRPGDQVTLTVSADVLGGGGQAVEARDFAFTVPEGGPPAELESAAALAFGERQGVQLRFSAPVSPLSRAAARLLDETGKEVEADRLVAPGGREWLLLPRNGAVDPRKLSLTLEGVEDARAQRLPAMRKINIRARE